MKSQGLTLIELLIAIVLGAFMAVLVQQFLGPLLGVGIPILNLGKTGQLRAIVENMTNDFNRLPGIRTHASLVTLQGRIGTVGSAVWNTYGSYEVVENAFVRYNTSFNEENDTGATARVLKVTVRRNDPAHRETLTTLFTTD